ncbi:Cthe_2314 family HEPN domain-containing protein [Metabacillus fastidiosus]|uniref:Cthe_2314 family HEPN domain-containing protein n=1 Tax=Metabacillus fastidiosus TaxID=1458 RepID=UPI002DBA09D0|nr:Cthe_2314 family HEPN domain-containing protein [Metabacillus fastidiosus]MEC2074571.1 Cthe_2314 family HEPN domain-containing protein [Metabacillus fastidiosus]
MDADSYKKYYPEFPDELKELGDLYNQFNDETDDILLAFNEYLKIFPIINYWRIEVFYSWDICRQSLVCATAVFEDNLRNIDLNDISKERIYNENIVEYYLDNVTYRVFSILEKIGQMVNVLMELGYKEHEVSYLEVKNKLIEIYPDHHITGIFTLLENGDSNNKKLRKYRNSITHRRDPKQQFFQLKNMKLSWEHGEGNEDFNQIIVNRSFLRKPELTIEELLKVITSFYHRLTDYIKYLFLVTLPEIIKRYEDEVEFYQSQIPEELKKELNINSKE